MQGSEDKGKVFHLYSDRNFRESKEYLQQEIAHIKAEMTEVERELRVVKAAGAALDELLLVLARMREIAVEAATNPQADRVSLSAELEQRKEQVNEIAAAGLASWSELDAARLRQMIADMERFQL